MTTIAPTGFEGAQSNALPTYIADSQGKAFEATFGRAKDEALTIEIAAVNARWPNPHAPPEALPYQGHDRRILRAPPESDAQYAARLLTAPDLWVWGGTPSAIVNIFAPYSVTTSTCTVLPNYGSSGLNTLDGNTSCFPRFGASIDSVGGYWSLDAPWSDTPPTADTWDDSSSLVTSTGLIECINGETWDSTVTISDLDYIIASIRVFKSPWSFPMVLNMQLAAGTPPVQFVLGHTWDEDAWLGGSETWDEGQSGLLWEDITFTPPSKGWDIS